MALAELIASLRLGAAALQGLQRFRRLFRLRRQVVFVLRQLYSGWTVGADGNQAILHVRAVFGLTNTSNDMCLIAQGVRLRQAGLRYLRNWQDCAFWDLGGEHVGPSSPGAPLDRRTTAIFQLQHPFRVHKSPPDRTERLSFNIIVLDQLNRRHRVRVRLRRFGPRP